MARLVHITDTFPPHTSGVAKQVDGLARHQAATGDAIHVLTATPLAETSPGRSRFRASTTHAPGLRVHRLASRVAFGLPVLPRGRATFDRALGLLRPDVVHLHLGVGSPFGYDAARSARGMDLPLVITWYSPLDGGESLAKLGIRLIGWETAPFVPSGVSEAVATTVKTAFNRDEVGVLPLGIDLEPWLSAGVNRVEGDGRVRILAYAPDDSAAALALRTIVRARADLGTDKFSLTVTGPGAGSLRPDLDDAWDRVSLLPAAPAEVMPTLSRAHDAYLSLAALDSLAAGARAAGLEVIGYKTAGLEDIGAEMAASESALVGALLSLAGRAHVYGDIAAGPDTKVARTAEHDWENVSARAQELYDLARTKV